MEYGKITKEELERVVEEIFNQPEPQERKMYLRNAHVEFKDGEMNYLHDPTNCEWCNNLAEMFRKEALYQLEEIRDNPYKEYPLTLEECFLPQRDLTEEEQDILDQSFKKSLQDKPTLKNRK